MRDLRVHRRDGEGVAPGLTVTVFVAILLLIATTLMVPVTASAQESADSTDTATSTTVADGAGRTTTSPTSAQARATTSASAPSAVPAPGPATVAAPAETAVAGPAQVRPFAMNGGIDVEITEIKKDGSADPNAPLKVNDIVEVHGTWDASKANPQPGDQFTIAFPAELTLTETVDFSLVGDDAIWGTCSVTVSTNVMTCTLSDEVTDRPEDVKGSFFVYSKAAKYTTTEVVNFVVNGQTTVPGDLPDGGIGDGKQIGAATKTGALQADKQSVRWTIDIPGATLAALDTDGDRSVDLTDELSDNMVLCSDRANPTLQSGRPGSLSTVAGGATVTQADGAGSPITVTVAPDKAFDPNFVYRVEYTTCTTSGTVDLPTTGDEDVRYSNTVLIGDDRVGAGVGQNWRPTTTPNKSGQILSGARYKKIDWTVTVPGTVFSADKDHAVTIAETLSTTHEVCADGLGVTVTKVDHLPKPGGTSVATSAVTGDFTIAPKDAAAGSRKFEIRLTPKNVSGFDPDKYYRVKYTTCVTGDSVPDDTVVFSNTAVVNGTSKSASVRGPAFTEKKSGSFNTTPVVVNGEEQPAGTTVSWKLTVPGHDLETLADPAVISDTFSDSLTVCEIGDDLKKNLNLKVTARDSLGGTGSRPTRDLSGDTSVVRDGNTLRFTLPRDAEGYSREVMYDLEYVLCTSSGGMDARGTSYSNSAEWQGGRANTSVKQSSGGGGTGQGVSRGSFSLIKDIHRFSEEFPVNDTQFTVRVEEFAPGVDPNTGTADATYTVKVKADGTPVSGLNARGAGWTIRLTEIDLPVGNGVYFDPGTFKASEGVTVNADATQAIVAIQPKSNTQVELVNRARHASASVSKAVTGNAVGELTGDESFVVEARLAGNHPQAGSLVKQFTLKAGQSFPIDDLPVGTELIFSEIRPADTDRITWSEPVITPQRLTIGADAAANSVVVTNTASITQGTFTVSKAVTGPEAANKAVPRTFDVTATWKDASGADRTKVLTVPSDGTAVPFGEQLPGGTTVTLTEQVPADGNGLAWSVPAFSGDVTPGAGGSGVVTIGKDTAEVVVTNVVDTNTGTLRLTKQVSGEAAEAVTDQEFTVEARWKAGTRYETTRLTVTKGQTTDLGVTLPVGTEVTFTEVATPEITGVSWGTPAWGTSPAGEPWLATTGGTATGIVSDEVAGGALVTLTNEASWKTGSLQFSKYLFEGADPRPAAAWDLPAGTAFHVRITGIDPALPAGTDFPAVGETLTLDAANGWSWESGKVLPKGTTVTFEELDPANIDGYTWARPFYYVATDAGEAGDRDTVTVEADQRAEVQIRNRPIRTADVAITKSLTGSKAAEIEADRTATFEVTATWSDPDGEARHCVLDVTPAGAMTSADCDVAVAGGRVQLPRDTEITLTETGRTTAVGNVTWGDPAWSLTSGEADVEGVDGDPASTVVTLNGDDDEVTLGLENRADLTEGTFSIAKEVRGPEAFNAAVPETFDVIASWTDAGGVAHQETLVLPADGSPVRFPYALPGHTEVTLNEVVPANGNGLRWGTPAYAGDVTTAEDGSAMVTIDSEQIDVTVRNYVETNDGTLRVTKQISGEAAEAVGDEEFTVEARWRDGAGYRTEQLVVRQGESTPLGVDLPYGTEVTFTEVATPEIPGVDWGTVTWGTDPAGDSWLVTHRDGTATGIVSDDPTDGRLVTLTNEAEWLNGSIGFTKYVLVGEDPVPAAEAGLPDDAAFEVRIDGIEPALPSGVDFPSVGETVTLDSGNGWSWESNQVLPRNTVITFSEVDPAPLDGIDWARPSTVVTADAGEPGERNTATIVPGAHSEVEVRNRPIPTAPVDIAKTVTGPKGALVARHESSTFQVTATWTDVDGVDRTCILDVTPGGGATPTAECDAPVLDGRAQFPLDTEIAFVETGAFTEVGNVNWGEVTWGVGTGSAEATALEGEAAGTTVVLTGDAGAEVTLGLVNATSSRGLILLPLPIPLPPFGGSSTPTGPAPGGPVTPGLPDRPAAPGDPILPQQPSDVGAEVGNAGGDPVLPERPQVADATGHAGAPGQPTPPAVAAAGPSTDGQSTLAVTGANVAWLGGAALALIAGGAWLALRGRREDGATE